MTTVQAEQPYGRTAVIPALWRGSALTEQRVASSIHTVKMKWFHTEILLHRWAAHLSRGETSLGSVEVSSQPLVSHSFSHCPKHATPVRVGAKIEQLRFKSAETHYFALFKLASYCYTYTPVLAGSTLQCAVGSWLVCCLTRSWRVEGSYCISGPGLGHFSFAQGLRVVGGWRTCLLVTAKLFTCYDSEAV